MEMPAYDYDITVIGGGPGGYVAAIRAAQEGQRTCLIEDGKLGGVCLNEGCIPTKTLIKTANLLEMAKKAGEFGVEGIEAEKLSVSMEKLQARKRAVVKQLTGGVGGLLRARGVTVVEGRAAFRDAHTVQVGDTAVTSANFVIATGSEAILPSFIKLEGKTNILTSREALELSALPASVAIIGGGVIGIEFAYLFNKLGVRVAVIELLNNILPMVDEEISGLVRERLAAEGVEFHLGAKVSAVRDDRVLFEQDGKPQSVQAEAVLMAVGRAPHTEGLHAGDIGVAFEKNAIRTNEKLQTSLPHIYAIGDVNGRVMLAHMASHEGLAAVENILGGSARVDYGQIPSCIYLEPEVAGIGLSEKQALAAGRKIKVGRFNMAGNGKSLVEGDTAGRIKVIIDEAYGEILGAHIYALHATEMIAEISLAMAAEATADDIIAAVHPHPTVSEAVGEAFLAAYGRAIHG